MTFKAQKFLFHIREDNGKTTIALASDYVWPSVDKEELKQLVDFLLEYIIKE